MELRLDWIRLESSILGSNWDRFDEFSIVGIPLEFEFEIRVQIGMRLD